MQDKKCGKSIKIRVKVFTHCLWVKAINMEAKIKIIPKVKRIRIMYLKKMTIIKIWSDEKNIENRFIL